jgi:imidazolonepropionase-like amidohydrolase
VKVAIVNLGQIISGDWRAPFAAGDTIISEGDRITLVGTAAAAAVESADVVIDAGGMTAIPGLIDSHVHITFGDYTRASARSVTSKATSTAASQRRSRRRRCTCRAAPAIRKASRRWRSRRSAASRPTGRPACA